ncbi:MAG: hypothetical protein K0R67_1031, partial [Paenibacillus sp.]|nr:hypothetical protein [Paenibacillus sp.]
MKVEIVQIGFQDYRFDIYHTWKLFFEEVELTYQSDNDNDTTKTKEGSEPDNSQEQWRMTIQLEDHTA